MEQALQDLRITSSILQRKYNDLESEKKQLEKDMEEERRALIYPLADHTLVNPYGLNYLPLLLCR